MLISKDHLRARFATSKDESRPLLQIIDIRRDKEDVVAAATDGYALIEVRQQTPEDHEFPMSDDRQAVDHTRITADTAAKLKPMMKSDKSLPILAFAQVTAEGVVTTDLKRSTIFHERQVEGNFPQYQQLIPSSEAAKEVVHINPAILASILKAFDGVGSVQLELHGNLSPVVIRSVDAGELGAEITGVVMPLKA